MTQAWRKELRTWAQQTALEFSRKEGVLGVIIGGSLARGQEWQHSDLELGILVEEKNPALPYFNVINGRGVEAIQVVRPDLEIQLQQVEGGDLSAIARWPIQLWLGKIVVDPAGILGRYKKQFDEGLFSPTVVNIKMDELRGHIYKTLDEARELLAQDRPAAALVRTRYAMNEAILVLHWSYGELPRSQNRTDSRLRMVCRKYDNPAFYALYRDVFALADAGRVIKNTWPKVRDHVLEITRLWGDSARDFFKYAVDSDFNWRQNAGILTVYRLYIPIIGNAEQGIFEKLDQREWTAENQNLMILLGLNKADKDAVSTLVERLAAACPS